MFKLDDDKCVLDIPCSNLWSVALHYQIFPFQKHQFHYYTINSEARAFEMIGLRSALQQPVISSRLKISPEVNNLRFIYRSFLLTDGLKNSSLKCCFHKLLNILTCQQRARSRHWTARLQRCQGLYVDS